MKYKIIILFILTAFLFVSTSAFVFRDDSKVKPTQQSILHTTANGFKWTGAWQPSRKSATDGITKLSIKIGNFITLPDKESLAQVIFNVNNKFPGSKPWITWAVGDLSRLTPAGESLSLQKHEEYLTYMDQLGVVVFLEIFPFKANAAKGIEQTDVPGAIDEWMNKFKQHPCIVGFGVDLEYYDKATDSAAKVWDEKLKAHYSSYRLFLRHYNKDYMPPAYRGKGDLIFIDHASEGTVEELSKGFADWANHFSPTACAFQLGYPADEDGMNGSNNLGWWKLKDPVKDWGNAILPMVNNASQELGLVWVTAKSGKTYNANWDLTKGAKIPKLKKIKN